MAATFKVGDKIKTKPEWTGKPYRGVVVGVYALNTNYIRVRRFGLKHWRKEVWAASLWEPIGHP